VSRNFLFLQGVSSPFFSRLADWLLARGETVQRVNLCAGDALYWRGKPAWHFRGAREYFGAWLEDRIMGEGVTDLVLFGDQRPPHRSAAALARKHGLRVHAFEEGYIRPNWITVERGGVNAASALPRDPAWYRLANEVLPDAGEGTRIRPSLAARAAHDMAYHSANLANCLAYPGYRTHRPRLAAVEYAAWARRYARFPRWRKDDAAFIDALIAHRSPFYFLPLQLNGDAQIVHHSPFGTMADALRMILRSFAQRAPAETLLVMKNHPFDTGLVDYATLIERLKRELGLAGRVVFLETGEVPKLLDHTLGVVVINSTVGFSALQHRRPTKTLGKAIYDLPGMTFQGGLDDFWGRLTPPDTELVRAFRSVVVHATQVNGGFYSRQGIATALEGCGRLLEPRSRLEQLLDAFPSPRGAVGATVQSRTPAVPVVVATPADLPA
jgi:capsular polysaccharide export protein